jgi:hypothetical protein
MSASGTKVHIQTQTFGLKCFSNVDHNYSSQESSVRKNKKGLSRTF